MSVRGLGRSRQIVNKWAKKSRRNNCGTVFHVEKFRCRRIRVTFVQEGFDRFRRRGGRREDKGSKGVSNDGGFGIDVDQSCFRRSKRHVRRHTLWGESRGRRRNTRIAPWRPSVGIIPRGRVDDQPTTDSEAVWSST